MLAPRIIPCLLYGPRGLVKTVRFRRPVYLGDAVNTARIFNDSEADELILLDIGATRQRRTPPLDVIAAVASECFMPLTYGGGVTTPDQVKAILNAGAEKVAMNTRAQEDPDLLGRCAARFGRQAVVASLDVGIGRHGKREVFTHAGRRATGTDPVTAAVQAERSGAGEILLNSIDRDGTMEGYDVELLQSVTRSVTVPVIAAGGAGSLQHCRRAVLEGGASAVAVGSLFVFHGAHRAVLINYPDRREAEELFR